MCVAINSPVSLILLLSWKWLPFKLNHVFWSKNEKFFRNQYVIAWDLKILCRYTAQSDVGSIEKCIWFTAGEMVDGSIISKFPGIARSIDYLISRFSQKVHQRHCDKETLMGLCEKLRIQLADERTLVSGQRRETTNEHQSRITTLLSTWGSSPVTRIKYWHFATMLNFYVSYIHFYNTYHDMFPFHVQYMSWLTHWDMVLRNLSDTARCHNGLNHFETVYFQFQLTKR